MKAKLLIAVVGPTAIGKTKLAINLAQHFKTEVLSADSRQFYKEMQVGTAVPSEDELSAVTHHFIQHKSILEQYTVGDFERESIAKLSELFKTRDMAIIVGGSGLYTDAVVNGLDQFPEVDSKVREELKKELETDGIKGLQEKLEKLDLVYYQKVDLENSHRIIRALEICIASGKPYSSFLNRHKDTRSFNTQYIGLKADREVMYDRINQRVDIMMDEGLLKEVEVLYPHKDLNALQTVGYKELFAFLEGKFTLDKAVEEIKKNTRRFAKRQLTWYRKNSGIFWIANSLNPQEMVAKVENYIKTGLDE